MRLRPHRCSSRVPTLAAAVAVALGATSLPLRAQDPAPPVAPVHPVVDTVVGHVRVDPYRWLRDDHRSAPEVIAYLQAENHYAEATMRHTEALQQRLYAEMVGRIKETDLSAPERIGEAWYYTRTVKGKQYGIFCRRRGSLKAPEEVLLDENALAGDRKYSNVSTLKVSPDGNLLAYTWDTTGGEWFTLFVKSLRTGTVLPDRADSLNNSVEWAADNRTLFYGRNDDAHRPYRVYRHALGGTQDVLVFEEPDQLYNVGLTKTKDRAYLLISAQSYTSSDTRYLRADQPTGEWRVLAPRAKDVVYTVEHHGSDFLIRTNDRAVNFKLMRAPETDPGRANWSDLVPERDSVLLEGMDVFRDYAVIYERGNAVRRIRVLDFKRGQSYPVAFPEVVSTFRQSDNPEANTDLLRFVYTSPITPASVYDFDMRHRTRVLKKRTEVPHYDPRLYATARAWARADDGTMVPISLLYKKPLALNAERPLLLYGYGSYGLSTDPTFSPSIFTLVDRGVVFAIAHIRGGQEMGRRWYDDGKMLRKRNTFTDFIASAQYLVAQRYTASDRLAIWGGSAGGLLMGAVTNMQPDLFRAVVAEVPFVDVINTMLDASIPLTTQEWVQWGDPHHDPDYTYMAAYAPYENVAAKSYPAILATAGLNDPRVAYWEPAKWVARLRATKTDHNLLLLKTNMGAGHGGSSGRYDYLKERAFNFAFVLDQIQPQHP